MSSDDAAGRPWSRLSERELEALHEVEVGAEWIQRAHGHLLAFHHAVGHGMDHFDAAEQSLRSEGQEALADELRDEVLPCGVVGEEWSYGIVEAYQEGLLASTLCFEETARDALADGERHVAERRQRRRWRERACRD